MGFLVFCNFLQYHGFQTKTMIKFSCRPQGSVKIFLRLVRIKKVTSVTNMAIKAMILVWRHEFFLPIIPTKCLQTRWNHIFVHGWLISFAEKNRFWLKKTISRIISSFSLYFYFRNIELVSIWTWSVCMSLSRISCSQKLVRRDQFD